MQNPAYQVRAAKPSLPGIAANAVQRMYAYIQQVIILIHNANRLLLIAIHFYFFKPCKAANTMINMRYIISRFKVLQLF